MDRELKSSPAADVEDGSAQPGSATFGAANLYTSAMNAALQEEMMRWFFEWYSPHAWEKWGRFGASVCYADAWRGLPLGLLAPLMPAVAQPSCGRTVRAASAPSGPVSGMASGSDKRADAGEQTLSDDADGPWPDMVDQVSEDPLAHTPAGDFNVELHQLEDAVYSGEFARDNPYEMPPGYKPTFRPWPKHKRTEPYEL
ncbi:hypothetical protein LXA47_01215 [Massilia sp. P8910]|uniref:hypothetical protein n=1 Tax=Massilia antarctica TaxID=2765360 RepID=UPI001E638E23|nr:hypothetical protein [Massilia antarctica]MCE3602234.1 hypothetical protein [Massilia antarctica]